VGCILAELLGGRPFFKGRDYVDQLNQILHYLGTPSEETLSRIGSQRVSFFFNQVNIRLKIMFAICLICQKSLSIVYFLMLILKVFTFGMMLSVALDLLELLLTFDPAQRITVETALEHPYLAIWHDPNDEPEAPAPFEFDFEHVNDMAQMKRISHLHPTNPEMIFDEVVRFRHLVRNQQPPAPVDTQLTPGLQRANSISQSTGGLPGAKVAQEASQHYEKPPRPQETQMYEAGGDEMGEVERELATGLDGR
jgi:mitogen-activated protein kinase 7